ncbi:SDR family NAD(P)-dependent oxidoreductase [Pontibacter sp. H249]|uniref:SDR family NAD(P)-dependent oxidoreductase n=1 Tax=Pontibacter sp. H249 TaxID=3133420 RepID=UPI0030C55A3B
MGQTQKIALITGGSRGLGKNAALKLAQQGTGIILTYLTRQDEANKVVAEIEAMGQKAVALQLDVADVKSFDNFIARITKALQGNWGTDKFDFLVNNAGIGATIPIADATEEAFDNLMNVHFKGVYFLTQKALPLLNDGGRIINLSTGTTRFCVPGYSMYASMKGAIETFTKYLAKELGPRGITANVLAPGAIETDFNNAAIRNNPQVKGFLASQTALGRVGEAEDIGGIIAFLCSEDARWINAQRIEASGGMFL